MRDNNSGTICATCAYAGLPSCRGHTCPTSQTIGEFYRRSLLRQICLGIPADYPTLPKHPLSASCAEDSVGSEDDQVSLNMEELELRNLTYKAPRPTLDERGRYKISHESLHLKVGTWNACGLASKKERNTIRNILSVNALHVLALQETKTANLPNISGCATIVRPQASHISRQDLKEELGSALFISKDVVPERIDKFCWQDAKGEIICAKIATPASSTHVFGVYNRNS